MQYINYARLDRISKTVKPYRGSTNRFPIGSRTQNTKVFYVEEENGERVFKICYNFKYIEHPVSKEEFIANGGSGGYADCSYRDDDAPNRYVRYQTVPRDLGIVRPDNTFEFTGEHYGQGDNTIMSAWTNGFFYRSSRHGGMVYRARRSVGDLFHPVFKGMRVDCDTMLTTTPYQVTGRRVMRKVAKDFLKQYTDFYKVSEAMMKSMSFEDFVGIGKDLMNELDIPKTSWGSYNIDSEEMHKIAQSRLHNSPLDSAVLYCMAHNIMEFARRVAYQGQNTYYTRTEVELPNLYDTMKRKLNSEIYRNNPEVMKPIEYVMGEMYPASEWGVTITVDGKEVQQY
jgi:hypothetical protein